MTSEEAIKILIHSNEYHHARGDLPYSTLTVEAFNMAINALSKQRSAKWIIKQDKDGKTYGECSSCRMKNYAGATMYCPDCGALMKGEK